jgi:hypothetical protein
VLHGIKKCLQQNRDGIVCRITLSATFYRGLILQVLHMNPCQNNAPFCSTLTFAIENVGDQKHRKPPQG